MAQELQQIAQLLEASLDPRTNKTAEAELEKAGQKPGYALTLLHIVASETFASTTRLAGALCFKNFLKRQWIDADGNHKLPQDEVNTIKRELVGLMISVPSSIQAQLGDAIGIIADSDFWRNWDTLVQELVDRLATDDYTVNIGVLQVAHSIFKRWRPLFRSDELFTEINHVLQTFGAPFLGFTARTDNLIDQSQDDGKKSLQLFNAMTLVMKLINDLSCQDLPPIFEENLGQIALLLQKYLSLDRPALHTSSDEESGPLEYMKSSVLEGLTLYAQKYEDAVNPYVGGFVQRAWNLLSTVGLEAKYDILVSKSLQFLTSVTRIPEHSKIFGDEAALSQIIEKVILPNLTLRDSDVELLEDDPIEFIRRDLEGSDSDTRRRAATDFLQGLLIQHEQLVTEVVQKYVRHFLEDSSAKSGPNWKSKDTAIHLFGCIAAKGSITSRDGVKSINERVNVVEFFQANVANDLVNIQGVETILKVDAIKYLHVFRSQFDSNQWAAAFPLVVQHLGSPHYIVYTYAAIAVERVLALTDSSGKPVVDTHFVISHAKDLLEHLFRLIEKDVGPDGVQSATKTQENEFLMRCVMRVLIVIREGLVPSLEMITKHLVEIIEVVSANPSNPRFCYYLFEALGAVIKFAGAKSATELESVLCPPFFTILETDIQDFIPYVIQLLAALLEVQPSASMPAKYKQLIPLVLKVDMWQLKGNVPALVRLLSSIITRATPDLVQNNQIESILGIFERLLPTRAHEVQACELLECILLHVPKQSMENYYIPLINLVLTKLDRAGEAFNSRVVKLYHYISANVNEGLGADFFIRIIDQLGEEKMAKNLYVTLYLKVILPGTPKLARPLDRKIAIISLTRTLTSSSAFAERYVNGWGFTCDRLLELLMNPPVIAQTDDVVAENDVDDSAFGVGFTQLVTIKRLGQDQWPEIQSVKKFVSDELKAADSQKGGQITRFVQERLTPESRQALISYMQDQ